MQKEVRLNQEWVERTIEEFERVSTSGQNRKMGRFLDKTSAAIIHFPNQSYEPVNTIRVESPDLFNSIHNSASDYAMRTWEGFSPRILTELVSTRANRPLLKDFYGKYIQGYFLGPKFRNQKVDSLYKFVLGAMDLANDSAAAREAVLIGMFQTDILPGGGDFHLDFAASRFVYVDQETNLKKASLADMYLLDFGELHFSNSERDQIKDNISKHSKSFRDRYIRASEGIIKRIGYEEYRKRLLAINDYMSGNARFPGEVFENWFVQFLRSSLNDPLSKKYFASIYPRVGSVKFAESVEVKHPDRFPNPFYISATHSGLALTIVMPEEASDRKQLVVESGKKVLDDSGNELIDRLKQDVKTSINPIAFTMDVVDSRDEDLKRILTASMMSIRAITEFDNNLHPIDSFTKLGLPTPPYKFDQLRTTNEFLRDSIVRDQTRFLNTRGVRVTPLHPKLEALGYEYIDFKRIDQNIRDTVVTLRARDLIESVRLDSNFNLDLEGKNIGSEIFYRQLQYILLSYLSVVVCEPGDKSPSSDVDLGNQIISRMGHLRWLPEGYRYSAQAVENFRSYEGGDLVVKDLDRKALNNRTQFTTYVSPVIRELEENLEPIKITLPNVLVF